MTPADWEKERTEVLKAVALLEQAVEGLRGDLGELRTGLTETLNELKRQAADRQRQFNDLLVEYAAKCVEIERTRLDLDGLKKRVEEIEKLLPAIRVVMWIGAALGASVVALIWALITGRAQVVFK